MDEKEYTKIIKSLDVRIKLLLVFLILVTFIYSLLIIFHNLYFIIIFSCSFISLILLILFLDNRKTIIKSNRGIVTEIKNIIRKENRRIKK